MNDDVTAPRDVDPLGPVVESFLARFRRGERPALTELITRHPELAGEIRELIPALVKLERLGGATGDLGEPRGGPDAFSRSMDEGPCPERLGEYLIIRRVGGGGMGVVYEAEHESLKSRVALKVVHPRFRTDPKYLRRFHAEARLAARLHHTNVVSVFDYGDHDGVCYYAMQFIEGQPLNHVLADIRLLRDEGTLAAVLGGPASVFTIAPAAGSPGRLPAAKGLLTGFVARPRTHDDAVAATEPLAEWKQAPSPPVATFGDGRRTAATADPSSTPGSSSLGGSGEQRYFREIARIGALVADALEYAHQRGVLHRDIKPSNLLLDALGNVWVTDFGLAKLEEGTDTSQSHELVGTLRYMAPERFRRSSDRRGDIYSLGATLYELLALRPPFDESDPIRLIDRIKSDPPIPPRQLDRNIPRDLETIILKALAKDPRDRFGSAGDLADELRRFLEGRPIRSRPVSIVEHVWRWCKRDPWLAGANITAALLITVLAIVSTAGAVLYRNQAKALSNQAKALSNQAKALAAERGRSDAASLDARWRAVDAYTAQARAGKFSRRPGQRFESLEAVSQAVKLLDVLPPGPDITSRRESLRDLAIACLALPDLKPAGRVISEPPGVIVSAFDSKLTRYALIFRDGRISVRSAADDREIASFRTESDRDFWIFAFSPDGRYLAVSQSERPGLRVCDIHERKIALAVPGAVYCAARFSPNSRRIVVYSEGELLEYDLAAARPVRRWPGRVNCLAFRPDGAQIVVVDNGSNPAACRILDWYTGRLVRNAPLRVAADDIAWSPDGTTLAISGQDLQIDLYDATTIIRRGGPEGHYNGGMGTAFHPTGALLASKGWEGRLRLWDPILGRPVLDTGSAREFQFSEDGRVVVAREDRLAMYDVDPAMEYRTFALPTREGTNYAEASVRDDGRLLAVGTEKGAALWDLVRGTELAFLPIGTAWHLMFDRSGDLITSGSMGVLRWPVHLDPGRGEFFIGPRQPLPLPVGLCGIDLDRSGTIMAKADHGYAYVATVRGTSRIGPLDDCRDVAVSPDGQWLATGMHVASQGAQVWRISNLAKVADLPVENGTGVAFSPDGRWLTTVKSPCRLWEVGTWREVRRIVGDASCFSPDGRVIVVQDASRMIRLVETETGRTLARLESPDLCRVHATFSSDGSRLVVTTTDGPAVHVWDLRSIRRQLAAMGLDWDAPAYSNEDSAAPSAPPLRRIQMNDFELAITGGAALAEEGRWDEAALAYSRAFTHGTSNRPGFWFEWAILNLAVGDAAAYRSTCRQMHDIFLANHQTVWLEFVAHALVLNTEGPAATALALDLAEERAATLPNVFSEHVIGLALYRAGRFAEALARLERNDARDPGWRCEILDRLVIAMAQKRLGRLGEARRSLEQAESWIAQRLRDRPGGPDRGVPEGWPWRDGILMHLLLDEARGVIRAAPPDLPDNAFAPVR